MDDILEIMATDLSLSKAALKSTILSTKRKYRKFSIKKASGGKRIIHQPSVELKPILYWIQINILDKLPVHKNSAAFKKGNSILNNASFHQESLYSIRVDIDNFFHSIKPLDLINTIKKNQKLLPVWTKDSGMFDLVTLSCFISKSYLPIGYLTSPQIANAVMFDIDSMLDEEFSNEGKYGIAKISRYADDFIFSTNKKGACKAALEEFKRIFEKSENPRLGINKNKTTYMSRPGGSSKVTGLRINNQGNIIVHACYRDHVRLLLKLYKENRLKEEGGKEKLVGHLAHIQNVDPGLFTKLCLKYSSEINELRK
uniref:retron St85 family RNA-directed DNA polymerase n=1 Tax=Castellaniella defragrans TaxID=75697 RepID=UPI003340917F